MDKKRIIKLYNIIWVDADYNIYERKIEASSKNVAIIDFFKFIFEEIADFNFEDIINFEVKTIYK